MPLNAAFLAGGPDTVTTRLKAAFAGYVRDYTERHPELKMA